MILGGFKLVVENKATKDFLQEHMLGNMMKQNKCFTGGKRFFN